MISDDTQTTYYISDNNLKSTTFVFKPTSSDSGQYTTIWIKGKSIGKPTIKANNFKE